jgi:hypothetical protein
METVTPTSEEKEETTEEVVEEETKEEEEVDYKALAEKNAELANNYKVRAEKAEKKAKEVQPSTSLPQSDLLYLAKADIHEEDVEELTTYAEKMGVSVKEAHEFLKPVFDIRQEQRKTAQTTETKSGRGKTQKTGDDYLDTALKTGELPDSDEAMQALILAKQKRKD